MSAHKFQYQYLGVQTNHSYTPMILDRQRAGQSYNPVTVRTDASGKVEDKVISPEEIDTFVTNAVMSAHAIRTHVGPGGDIHNRIRHDSAQDARFDAFVKYDPRAAAAKAQLKKLGLDSAVGGGIEGGLWLPYELATISGKVLAQPMPPLTARSLFPVNSEAAVGAAQYTIRRTNVRGMASWAGQGAQTPIPNVRLNRNEITTGIRYGVAAFKCTIFDLASAGFANFLLQDRGIQGVVRSLAELENYTCWRGDVQVGLYGVLNHPYCYHTLQDVTSASTSQEIADAVLAVINAVYTANYATFKPTHVALSPKLMAYLMGRTLTVGGVGVSMSVLEWVARNNVARIPLENFVDAQELTDAGPGSTQGMFVYGKDEDAVRIISTGGPAALPVQYTGVDVTQIFYQGMGGLNMYNPANNAVAFFDLG